MTVREVEHEITVQAPAAEVYRLIAEVTNWPLIFPPSVYVDHVERGEREERIRIWATANGTAKNWTSRRTLDPQALRITFRQEVSAPPVAAMGGTWIIEPSARTAPRCACCTTTGPSTTTPDRCGGSTRPSSATAAPS